MSEWARAFFQHGCTTAPASRKAQARDLGHLIVFLMQFSGSDRRDAWTPRASKAFVDALRKAERAPGVRRWQDKSVNRVIATAKTFAKWVHNLAPFALGNPMADIRQIPVSLPLDVERAVTAQERARILDAADLLHQSDVRKDRSRFRGAQRPASAWARPWRNRAIVYTLLETGMRRAAVVAINLADIDFAGSAITVEEKGGVRHRYKISKEGLSAIRDYLSHERPKDAEHYGDSPAAFLPTSVAHNSTGRLSARMVNDIWNAVCRQAGVVGKTPHSARHAMGKHIMDATGNVAAVQRQLGHRNASYSMQYARIGDSELDKALNERK
ncbi:MAG TPA: site-specific integrase [Magnetospirillum sp.]|nr:site-specific integrase [Magnetospirillum sp.]